MPSPMIENHEKEAWFAMLTIYLACLFFGGLLILVTIAFGAESDFDLDLEADVDMDAAYDVHGEGLTAAVQFLSFRNFVFFTAFFGLTGSLMTWTGAPFLVTLVSAILMGLVSAFLCHKMMIYLRTSEIGEVTNLSECVGINAHVILPIDRDHRGKVSVATHERKFQMLAEIADEATRTEFDTGDEVTVVRVVDGVAQIAGEDFIG